MVAVELQKDLADEIRKLTSEMSFNNPNGPAKLNVYIQNLPMRRIETELSDLEESELDEDTDPTESDSFPYIIVRLSGGLSESATSSHDIKVILIAGIWDNSFEANGHIHILNIFENIRERFRKNPALNNRYLCQDKIEWALQDDDENTFPYFFGAMEMNWTTAEYRREDYLA